MLLLTLVGPIQASLRFSFFNSRKNIASTRQLIAEEANLPVRDEPETTKRVTRAHTSPPSFSSSKMLVSSSVKIRLIQGRNLLAADSNGSAM